MNNEPVNVGDKIEPIKGIFMPYWEYGATVVEVGMPMAFKNDTPKFPGGDWVIISSYGGWLPRNKFQKVYHALHESSLRTCTSFDGQRPQ